MRIEIPPDVSEIIARLTGDGFEAFLVGGCVRDSLRGKAPSDYDIATNAVPAEISRVFLDAKRLYHGEKHGTVGVVTECRVVEITTYRVDGAYSDARRPDSVTFTPSLKEDLLRRDFTMNALAYNPKDGLVDISGGQADLRAGLVRCVGTPSKRFAEDALRILRAFRFASALDFEIERETARAAFLMGESLHKISRERIRAELEKLLLGASAGRVLQNAREIIGICIPETLRLSPEMYADMASAVNLLPVRPEPRFAAVFASFGPADLRDAMSRLTFSNALSDAVRRRVQAMRADYGTALALKKAIGQFGPEAVLDALFVREAYGQSSGVLIEQARALIASGACVTIGQLAVNGRDVVSMGVAPGESVGRILERLLEGVMAEAFPNEREALLGAIRTFL